MAIRCFAAIELDTVIAGGLGQWQGVLKRKLATVGSGISWVRANQIHLTLKFLGEVEDGGVMEVCEALSLAAGECSPFEIEVGGCGCFPPGGSARVVWAGITRGAEELAALQQVVDGYLNEAGYPLEARRFSPHLTLARIKKPSVGYEVRDVVEKMELEIPAVQEVGELTLFQSVLTREGPVYTAMHHAELGGKGGKP